jgi:hypothetical protein
MACVGLTNIILESNIFAPIRNFLSNILPTKVYEVFECHQCMGVWVGFLIGYLLFSSSVIIVLVCGFASSFLCDSYSMIYKTVFTWVMKNTGIDIETGEIDPGLEDVYS